MNPAHDHEGAAKYADEEGGVANPAPVTSASASSSSSPLVTLTAGGLAGAVSRTVVAPLERTKILCVIVIVVRSKGSKCCVHWRRLLGRFQVQVTSARGAKPRHTSVISSLVDIGRKEGVRGLYRGNMANCVRIVPGKFATLLSHHPFPRPSCHGQHHTTVSRPSRPRPSRRIHGGA